MGSSPTPRPSPSTSRKLDATEKQWDRRRDSIRIAAFFHASTSSQLPVSSEDYRPHKCVDSAQGCTIFHIDSHVFWAQNPVISGAVLCPRWAAPGSAGE